MPRRLVALGEETAALEHQIDAELLPRELGGIALRDHTHRLPVEADAVLLRPHVAAERAVHRVVLEEMRERLRVGDVVHGDELEPALVEAGAQDVSADAPETIDASTDRRHGWSLLCAGPRGGNNFYFISAWNGQGEAPRTFDGPGVVR